MKKVLLIHPWIEDFSAYDFWIKPMGLLTVGTALRKAGLEVGLVDCLDRAGLKAPDRRYGTGQIPGREIDKPQAFRGIPRRFKRFGMGTGDFQRQVAAFGRPDLILMSCMMTYWYTGAFRAIRLVKEIYPDVPVGLGGNYATLCPGHAATFSGADVLLPGKDLRPTMKALQALLGIGELPYGSPPDKIDYSFYPEVRSLPVLTSRGCPFHCSYCAAPLLHPGFIQEEPGEVISEIAGNAAAYGVRDFAFFDDALLVRVEAHLHPILREVIRRKLRLRFHLPNAVHAKAVTQETADLMMEAGFKTVRLGLESSDPAFQRRDSSGKVDTPGFLRGVERLRKAGFTPSELGAYVLYGLPGQTEDGVLRTLEAVYQAGIRSYLSTFSPVPGTPCFREAAREGPAILHEPLLHNKHLCCFRDSGAYRRIKERANALNRRLDVRPACKGP